MARQSRSPQRFWDDGLKLISFCPLCEAHYHPREAQLVGEAQNSHLLHITCQKCQHAIIALILVSAGGVSSVGLVTDLSYEDTMKFREAPVVSADDVLEVHESLRRDRLFLRKLCEEHAFS